MIHQKLFRLFLLFLPTQLAFHIWPDYSFVFGIRSDYLSVAIYFVDILWIVTFLFWFIPLNNKTKFLKRYWQIVLVVVVVGLANILFSFVPQVSVYRWFKLFSYFTLYAYINFQGIPLVEFKKPLFVSLCFSLLLALSQIISAKSAGGVLYFLGERTFNSNTPGIALGSFLGREFLRPYATFPHPNALGGFGLVSAFLLMNDRSILSRISIALGFGLCLLSYSQNAWFALIFAPLVYMVLLRLPSAKLKFIISSAVASLFLTIGNTNSSLSQEFARRVSLASISGMLLASSPVVGSGLGTFVALLPSVMQRSDLYWWLQPVHNIFLLIASEVGLVGLVLFTFFLYKNTNRVNLLAVIAIIFTGMFDHYWITLNQTTYLMFMVLAVRDLSGRIEK